MISLLQRESMSSVTVVIPTYNRADLLPRAIDSVLSQSFEDFELIIVDDGSTDNTPEVVNTYSDPRIQYIKRNENLGANRARNEGINRAESDVISFLDSDDELHPEYLETAMKKLRSSDPDTVGVFTSFEIVEDGEVTNVCQAKSGTVEYENILVTNVIGTFSCVTFKKHAFEDVGMLDEELESCQDYDFYIRVLKKHDVAGINDVLVTYHKHSDRVSTDMAKKIQGWKRLLEKHGDEMPPEGIARRYYVKGKTHMELGEKHESRRSFLRALQLDHKDWRYYYYTLASALGCRSYSVANRIHGIGGQIRYKATKLLERESDV